MDCRVGTRRELFISRAGADRALAIDVARILHGAGYATFLQDEDFGHASFMAKMAEGFAKVEAGGAVVALLSRAYLKSEHCLAEAHYPLTDDPQNKRQRLIVLRIEDCAPVGFLKPIPYIDLVPVLGNATALRQAVIGAVDPVRRPKAADFRPRPGSQHLHPQVRPVPGFTARGDELAAVEAALWRKGGRAALTDTANANPTANADAAAAAVRGMGGVGKSVLAQQYAWESRARYQGVWWLRAEARDTLLDDLIALGTRFNAGIAEMPDRAAAAQVVLDHIAQTRWEKPWLLVYDNVESPKAIAGLTPTKGAHVLATTRWADWHGHAEEVAVDVFPPEVAVDFLLGATKGTDRAASGRLAEALGRLPLALDHAAAYMRRTGIGFDAYAALARELLLKAPKGVGYERPVLATFTLAIAKAVESCPAAEKLIGLVAFLAPEGIPLDLFTAKVLGEVERGEAVAALTEVSLVTRAPFDDGTPGLSVHRLVQQAARRRLADRGEEASTAATATALVADAYPYDSDDVRNWPACARLNPHALAVFEHAPDRGEGAGKTSHLLNQTAVNYVSRAAYAEAEPLMRRALAIDEASYGADHPRVAIRLNNLAQLLQATNRLGESEPLMRRALAIGEASYGADHPRVAIRLNNLASLLQATNRLGEAEPLMRRALAIDEASYGADHPHVAIRLNNLAQLFKATNRLGEAEPLMRRALAIDEASYGAGHPRVAIRLNNLAALLKATNRLGEAEPLMRRALAIDEASYGAGHPDVAIDLNNLASLLQATNRLGEAEPLMRRALAIFERSLGAGHPSTRTVRANLEALLAVRASASGRSDAETGAAMPTANGGRKRGFLARLLGG